MKEQNKRLSRLLHDEGLARGCSLMVHSSFSFLKSEFGENNPEFYISELESVTGNDGALIMPAFTYGFLKAGADNSVVFNPESTPSLTGYLTERFRHFPGVTRTHSPTHSFLVKGNRIPGDVMDAYSESPLGRESFIGYFSGLSDSYVLLAGCTFQSLTLLHYIENIAENSYTQINPWKHLGILPFAMCYDGLHKVTQIPGCSKGFNRAHNRIKELGGNESLREITDYMYLIRVNNFIPLILKYLQEDRFGLLCEPGTCQACDSRRMNHD